MGSMCYMLRLVHSSGAAMRHVKMLEVNAACLHEFTEISEGI